MFSELIWAVEEALKQFFMKEMRKLVEDGNIFFETACEEQIVQLKPYYENI